MELDKIVQHDVAKPFPLPDESIDVVITSPPYSPQELLVKVLIVI